MKKLIYIAIAIAAAFFATINNASAQNPFSTGNVLVQGVIGIPSNTFGSCRIPPIGISLELGIVDMDAAGVIGVGGSFEYSEYDFAKMSIEGIVNYHYFFSPSFDVHARVGIGYYQYGESVNKISGAGRSFFTGATYFVNDNIGITVEAGVSRVTSLRAGVTVKF